ncbi:2-amino-4-hydroxy-6-hydroxymethyldihydropteridine diphosphokinase [bacterium]|nr:2-amino-4-hydroxy-6-hydroxymethyldihydropteridine diphosphokinase [bacterium]
MNLLGSPRAKKSMARCLVGCGSNLGARRDLLERAVELLRFMPGVNVLQTSHFRESKAVGGPVDQPAFLNGACLLETDLPPQDLLDALQAVENTLERQRDIRWGPRTIDLDLLLYDTLELDDESLTVPHPRMSTRRFVLEPCVEIAPDFLHPCTGYSLRELLDNISLTRHRITHGCTTLAHILMQSQQATRQQAFLAAASVWQELLTSGEREESTTHVADFWIGTLAAVAARHSTDIEHSLALDVQSRAALFEPPHVLIMLHVSPDALRERIRFCQGPLAAASDIFKDLEACLSGSSSPAGNDHATGNHDEAWCDHLLSLQTDIERMLSSQRTLPPPLTIPKAVVHIDADDLGEAADEALAAVEAMA